MTPFPSYLFTRKFIAYMLPVALALVAISLSLTFLISKTQGAAANAVLYSTDVERRLENVSSALLIGSASRFPGPNGCMDFHYLVFGKKGVVIAHVRAEANNSPSDSTRVVEVIVGWSSEFSKDCWATR